jgi:hypothetical protein
MANKTIDVYSPKGLLHKFCIIKGKCYEFIAINANNKAFKRKETTMERINEAEAYANSLMQGSYI